VVIYRLIYMVFYLFFILSFQVGKFPFEMIENKKFYLKISFEFWRKTLATFHLIIIIYSMIILIGLFIYQVMF
jgi:ABC-type proline/glycine betaine transport system permease subunit